MINVDKTYKKVVSS